MAFKEHPKFSPPSTVDATIWRYMDLAKFISLLDKAALYFPRVDKLDAEDPFEGYYTNFDVTADMFVEYEVLKPDGTEAAPPCRDTILQTLKQRQLLREHVKADRAKTFVCSWHAQEHESAAMWKLYVKSGEGIAIESTYARLLASLKEYKDFEVNVGMINYLDYRRDAIPRDNLISPFMHKRKSFEHEKELRALIWTPQHGKNTMGSHPVNTCQEHPGLYVPTNLATLVNRILVAPTAPPWIAELVKSVTRKYGFEIPVFQSDLASRPIY